MERVKMSTKPKATTTVSNGNGVNGEAFALIRDGIAKAQEHVDEFGVSQWKTLRTFRRDISKLIQAIEAR
jgi:hypothetical protein